MIELDPPFKLIYDEPVFLAFGGIGISCDEPYNTQKFTTETSSVLKSILDFLKRSYEVRGKVEQEEKVLKTRIEPVEGKLDRGDYDINLKPVMGRPSGKYIDGICKRMVSENNENAIICKDNGFDIFHLLKSKFDPNSAMNLIKATESLLLESFEQSYNVLKSEIKPPHYLEHDIEMISPREIGVGTRVSYIV
jgi:hypothetical protein